MDYEKIFAEALAAANAAQEKLLALYGGKEPEYACGFAWVRIFPATDPAVKWCKAKIKEYGVKYDSSGNLVDLDGKFAKHIPERHHAIRNYGSPGYPKGWEFWAPGDFRGQWVDCKEAGAMAFAGVLKSYDIPATWSSRLD